MTGKKMLPKEDAQLVGSQLRYIRNVFNLTTEWVAGETCLSAFTIGNAERGHSVSKATCNHLLYFYLCLISTYSDSLVKQPAFDSAMLKDAFKVIRTTLFSATA